jgi:hypothetical protein
MDHRLLHALRLAGALSVLCTAPGACAAGDSTAATSARATRPDSIPPAVAGTPTILLHAFRSDDRTLDLLFPDGARERVIPDTVRGAAMQRRLAELTEASPSAFSGSAAAVWFPAEFYDAVLLTADGDGFALRPATHFGAIDLRVCAVRGGKTAGRLATRRMERSQSLLLRTQLDGRPHVVVVRCLLIPRSEIAPLQLAFRDDVALVTGAKPAVLHGAEVSAADRECLDGAR